MNINRDTIKAGVDVVADVIQHGMSHLQGNDAINPIARSMLTPIGTASDMWRSKSVVDPLVNAYMKNVKRDATGQVIKNGGKVVLEDGINVGNIAGSYLTVGLGAGVLGGLTHDSAGNPDIAGIPMI